jgi:murein DD-endopeptidase MepM/ murein hydrolase activator NlpD
MKKNIKNYLNLVKLLIRPVSAVILIFLMHVPGYTQLHTNPHTTLCNVSKEEMNELNTIVQANIFRLKAEGKLDFNKYSVVKETDNSPLVAQATANTVLFRCPLVTAAYRDFPSWHINNFVDLDSYSDGDDNKFEDNERADYNCGKRTYDGHQGIDIDIHPYKWKLKESGFVQVVAAADGIIVHRHSGEFDENCDWDNATYTTGRGNNIVILHNDGTTASLYMHIKDGSLTAKTEGDFVYAGEYLGTVASSGNSTGPHLHFQVNTGYVDNAPYNDDAGARIDPFANGDAGCIESTSTSWINERPYNDPAVLTLETHSADPQVYDSNCDKTINLYTDNTFTTSQIIFFRSEIADWVDGTTINHKVFKPDGTLWLSYNRTNSSKYRVIYPEDQGYLIPSSMPSGTYRYSVTFGGKTYSHYFTINCAQNLNLTGAVSGHKGYMVSNTITSVQIVSSTSTNYLKYMADQKVVLSPGFRAGCRFVANLQGCEKSISASLSTLTQQTQLPVEINMQQNISAKELINDFAAYPNPSTGPFTIRYKQDKIFNAIINIWSIDGTLVYVQRKNGITNLQEKVSLKSKGVYLIELNMGNKSLKQKIIIL